MPSTYPTLTATVGNTPLVQASRLLPAQSTNTLLLKLEGNNPAGSVKDRAAFNMLNAAQQQNLIRPGDNLIEATSGNTGIALAMACAMLGYSITLIMPNNATKERQWAMQAYGAQLILVSAQGGMEEARDLALELQAQGKGLVLNQFANENNPNAHYQSTAPEIWQQSQGKLTHFISSMGTTGTIMGCSRYFKEQNPAIEIIGLQPAEGASIPGIRRWPQAYLPAIFDAKRVDCILDIEQAEAEHCMRELARKEGIFAGVSSGGAVAAALKLEKNLKHATLVAIICDRGDRYLSSGIYAHTKNAEN